MLQKEAGLGLGFIAPALLDFGVGVKSEYLRCVICVQGYYSYYYYIIFFSLFAAI